MRRNPKEGLEASRRRGRIGGRPKALSQTQRSEIADMLEAGRPIGEIAALFKVSESTVRRVH
ncbi:MAG: helix-turn-helix domain-containing protein [Pseudomonadota bacterium]